MVGDQPGTDGLLAERLGIPFVLVDSGVTAAGTAVDDVPGGRAGPRLRHPGRRSSLTAGRPERDPSGSQNACSGKHSR